MHVGDFGMGMEEVLHLARVDVLTTANDGIFGPPLEAEVAVGVHDGEIAGVQPALGVDGGGRWRRRVVVIALHDQVAARTQLALPADLQALSALLV